MYTIDSNMSSPIFKNCFYSQPRTELRISRPQKIQYVKFLRHFSDHQFFSASRAMRPTFRLGMFARSSKTIFQALLTFEGPTKRKKCLISAPEVLHVASQHYQATKYSAQYVKNFPIHKNVLRTGPWGCLRNRKLYIFIIYLLCITIFQETNLKSE